MAGWRLFPAHSSSRQQLCPERTARQANAAARKSAGAESAPQSRSIPAANSRSIALNSPVAASWEESAAMF
ncbi:MAG: hypothetical protein L6W00_19555 [Lentisphaeria bacterium]|nr:MAG: hypothetical protein L6W00_19555 [Lentisphaeria bacterium]